MAEHRPEHLQRPALEGMTAPHDCRHRPVLDVGSVSPIRSTRSITPPSSVGCEVGSGTSVFWVG